MPTIQHGQAYRLGSNRGAFATPTPGRRRDGCSFEIRQVWCVDQQVFLTTDGSDWSRDVGVKFESFSALRARYEQLEDE